MNILISDTLISQFKNVKVKLQTDVSSLKTIQYKRSRPVCIFSQTFLSNMFDFPYCKSLLAFDPFKGIIDLYQFSFVTF
jgi:hypothetical protein